MRSSNRYLAIIGRRSHGARRDGRWEGTAEKEVVREDFCESGSFVGDSVENLGNEIDGGGGEVVIGWEFVVVLLDLLVDVLDVLGLKWWFADEESVSAG